MRQPPSTSSNPLILVPLLLMTLGLSAQCELFKSEMVEVQRFMMEVSQITDSLATVAESASHGAHLKSARSDAKEFEALIAKAYTSSEEAATMSAEAQYYSEVCGQEGVITYANEVEDYATDARDFAEEAYANAKAAVATSNLGDIRYYVRKAHVAIQEAQNAADFALIAASNSLVGYVENGAIGDWDR